MVYTVTIDVTHVWKVTVEAEDEHAARMKAVEAYRVGEAVFDQQSYPEVVDIEEVE